MNMAGVERVTVTYKGRATPSTAGMGGVGNGNGAAKVGAGHKRRGWKSRRAMWRAMLTTSGNVAADG